MNSINKEAIVWIDGPSDGAWNMALDQAMVQHASAEDCIILRLYQWARPTLSLGYFQTYEEGRSIPALKNIDCVRRVTGGGAIIHDHEITYSIAVPKSFENLIDSDSSKAGGPSGVGSGKMPKPSLRHSESLYRIIHARTTQWLRDLGFDASIYESITDASQSDTSEAGPDTQQLASCSQPDCKAFLCFDRRSDVDIVLGQRHENQKVLGSAQRRTSGVLLQHGSLLLAPSAYAPHLTGVDSQMLQEAEVSIEAQYLRNLDAKKWGWTIDFCRVLQDSVDSLWSCEWRFDEPNQVVLSLAHKIKEKKFSSDNWTIARHKGEE